MATFQTGILLLILALWITEPGVEGCSCAQAHLQQHFCYSDIVIRAKVIGEQTVFPTDSLHGEEMIEYKIKLIKMFKGFDKVDNLTYVYTSVHESLCGVRLDAKNKVQYLLSGSLFNQGKVEVELCGIVEPWDELPLAQRKNLHRYQKGCECEISSCYEHHCRATKNKCVWHPYSEQTVFGVCTKHANGSCGWIM
ncbi:metalloproteinase inhibitor 4-like [Trichomycterus rosablanca]|uniref:metalloproteinase inhibitor 4-like n=1 Tax=Trichomycterus rosablanca TaxID=2290929 RepID=UPI002F35F04F